MATKSTRTKASRERAQAVIRGSAGEPTIMQEDYRTSFIEALNWYSLNEKKDGYRNFAENYAKVHDKDALIAIKKASDLELKYIGIVGRLQMRGQYLSDEHVIDFNNRVRDLKQKYNNREKKKEVLMVEAPKVNVQDRILESANKLAGDIDAAIDDFITDGTNFSIKNYLLSNSVSAPVAKRIGEKYVRLVKELRDAHKGNEPQLKEAYSHLTKTGLRKLGDFVHEIIDGCSQQVVSAKAQRKPRARKEKPPAQIASKVKYMKEYEELKMKSVSPSLIVGASEVWVYQPAKRKLSYYTGADGGSLTIKGTTIQNFDANKSGIKTIRDPNKLFSTITSTGKRAMGNVWKGIKTKPAKVTGRIGEDAILYAVN